MHADKSADCWTTASPSPVRAPQSSGSVAQRDLSVEAISSVDVHYRLKACDVVGTPVDHVVLRGSVSIGPAGRDEGVAGEEMHALLP